MLSTNKDVSIKKDATIIEGFPGVGLVASIATEYLIEHLGAKLIGKMIYKQSAPIAAIHNFNVIEPFGIYYSEEKNIVLIHGLSNSRGLEWDIADDIISFAEQNSVKNIISLEGVPSNSATPRNFFYTQNEKLSNMFSKLKAQPIKNGVILGVTSALLIKNEHIPQACLFVESHPSLPDSKGAALLVEDLNYLFEVNIDVKPLLDQAKIFEDKLKQILTNTKQASEIQKQKILNYVG